jgi:hypothetical protein
MSDREFQARHRFLANAGMPAVNERSYGKALEGGMGAVARIRRNCFFQGGSNPTLLDNRLRKFQNQRNRGLFQRRKPVAWEGEQERGDSGMYG